MAATSEQVKFLERDIARLKRKGNAAWRTVHRVRAKLALRRKQLRKEKARLTGGAAAARWALQQVGRHEDAGRPNRGAWVDGLQKLFGVQGVAWCGCFALRAAWHGGAKLDDGGIYTPNIYNGAKRGINGYAKLVSYSEAEPGDLVLFKWPGISDDVCDHVGVYVGGGRTVEGNTSPGNGGSQNNGGGVYLRSRGTGNVAGVARPIWP